MDYLLNAITSLSHEFGSKDYVCGGGGNTSGKDGRNLWIKPSGTTLAGLAPNLFLQMDRARMQALYNHDAPVDPQGCESFVRRCMDEALCVPGAGRPSVEAPLHESFAARYVVHTHPALLNGLACATDGESTCRRLFPEALWIPYTDPGYTLCVCVRAALHAYARRHGCEPAMVVLQNHGVFVAGDEPEAIRMVYAHMMTTLKRTYADAGVSLEPPLRPEPPLDTARVEQRLHDCFGSRMPPCIASCGRLDVATVPLTPDHIVYCGAFPYIDSDVPDAAGLYLRQYGRPPRLVVTESGTHGLGATPAAAELVLTLACDGAWVCRLATAFGGVHPLGEHAWRFIEGWEAEAYRRSVSTGQVAHGRTLTQGKPA